MGKKSKRQSASAVAQKPLPRTQALEYEAKKPQAGAVINNSTVCRAVTKDFEAAVEVDLSEWEILYACIILLQKQSTENKCKNIPFL